MLWLSHFNERVFASAHRGRRLQPWNKHSQTRQHLPSPFVPSLLPVVPSHRYKPLIQPEKQIRCAFYPSRNYPPPSLYGFNDTGISYSNFKEWSTLAPTMDYLCLPYFKPFSFQRQTANPACETQASGFVQQGNFSNGGREPKKQSADSGRRVRYQGQQDTQGTTNRQRGTSVQSAASREQMPGVRMYRPVYQKKSAQPSGDS